MQSTEIRSILTEEDYKRLESLSSQLLIVVREYQRSLDKDEIFEVRKKIQLRMRALQAEIDAIERRKIQTIN